MPRLIESIMVETAKTRFRGFNLTPPSVVAAGTPVNPGQFLVQNRSTGGTLAGAVVQKPIITSTLPGIKMGAGLTSPVRLQGTPQGVPPALFKAASNDKADVDFQAQVSNEYSNYLAAICHAIVSAHDDWRASAHLQGVVIMAVSASGGSVTGPSLSPGIIGYAGSPQGLWGSANAFTRAIADGVASCWAEWQLTVKVPNLPWYPAFAAVPARQAPPMPNVPTPLAALSWSSASLSADYIKSTIARKLSAPGPYSDEVFQSVATGFTAALQMWFPAQSVANVLGMGPIPNFAPPYVPVAPVVGGSIVEAGSHFST